MLHVLLFERNTLLRSDSMKKRKMCKVCQLLNKKLITKGYRLKAEKCVTSVTFLITHD